MNNKFFLQCLYSFEYIVQSRNKGYNISYYIASVAAGSHTRLNHLYSIILCCKGEHHSVFTDGRRKCLTFYL